MSTAYKFSEIVMPLAKSSLHIFYDRSHCRMGGFGFESGCGCEK